MSIYLDLFRVGQEKDPLSELKYDYQRLSGLKYDYQRLQKALRREKENRDEFHLDIPSPIRNEREWLEIDSKLLPSRVREEHAVYEKEYQERIKPLEEEMKEFEAKILAAEEARYLVEEKKRLEHQHPDPLPNSSAPFDGMIKTISSFVTNLFK